MQLFYQPEIVNNCHHLDSEESRHCVQVLRKKEGDIIHITDGKGGLYTAKIIHANKKDLQFRIKKTEKTLHVNYQLELAISPTKSMNRMEWFVEKCVELGIDHLYFIKCHHSERQHIHLERLNKKAISAMKQSLKTFLPTLHPIISFEDMVVKPIQQKFIAHVDNENPILLISSAKSGVNIRVLIGPEGDFSINELNLASENGYLKISLGKSRLRTETAGVAACHILNIINDH